MKKTLLSIFFLGLITSASAGQPDVVHIFKDTFQDALPTKYEWVETDEWHEGLTTYVFLYENGIKAELRVCVSDSGSTLVSGTTTGGYREQYDQAELDILKQYMSKFWESINPSLVADPESEGCKPEAS